MKSFKIIIENREVEVFQDVDGKFIKPDIINKFNSFGTALKPAVEPIVMARKPFKGTVVNNVLEHGTGGINIDECRVGHEGGVEKTNIIKNSESINSGFGCNGELVKLNKGRHPANFIHDGSDEVIDNFPDTKKGGSIKTKPVTKKGVSFSMEGMIRSDFNSYDDSGNASRFFYCAKTSKTDRNEGCEDLDAKQYSQDGRDKEIENAYQRNKSVSTNNHPTVKPTDLMMYLVKLITPYGGTILDPFNGSGSTGKAIARLNNEKPERDFKYLGIEMDKNYCDISEARIKYEIENKTVSSKSKNNKMDEDPKQITIDDFL